MVDFSLPHCPHPSHPQACSMAKKKWKESEKRFFMMKKTLFLLVLTSTQRTRFLICSLATFTTHTCELMLLVPERPGEKKTKWNQENFQKRFHISREKSPFTLACFSKSWKLLRSCNCLKLPLAHVGCGWKVF